MALDTLEKARAALYSVLNVTAVNTAEGVSAVYDHDPILNDIQPPAVVTIFAVGQDREFYEFVIRVYYDTSAGRPETAQKCIGGIIDAVDDAIVRDPRVGPGGWTIDTTPGREALMAELPVTLGREDF